MAAPTISKSATFWVAPGTQTIFEMENTWNATISLVPDDGATATLEASVSPLVAIEQGVGDIWHASNIGSVTAKTFTPIETKLAAIRVTATGGRVYVEVCK